MTIAGHLRNDEEFIIRSVAKEFSATWRPGENPPDAYLLIGTREIAVEISTLTQHITDDRGTRSRISDDAPAIKLANELDNELRALIPCGHTIGLVLRSPIFNFRRTKAVLAKMLRERFTDPQSFTTGIEIEINGNVIKIFRNHHGEPHYKKISAIIAHRHSDPDILCNARHILEERITVKARKCEEFVGRKPLWLALFNDYWLADAHAYRDALSHFNSAHAFERILLANRDGTVDLLY